MANAFKDDPYRTSHGLLSKSWVGGPILGKGAYGAPQVWLKQNEHGCIIDRVAIKDTEITKSYVVASYPMAVPVEALAPILLQRLPGGHNVVSLRNWRQDEGKGMVRLYQEFCPFGTLRNLLEDYRRRYPSATAAGGFPEAFIWHVFWCLTTVGLLMQRRAVDGADVPTNGWATIVHGDMKPENIFLGTNQGSDWKGYPTTKLGDWGLAELYKDGRSALGAGFLEDYCYSPPEMRGPTKGLLEGLGPPHDYPARKTTQTNVWAVGLQIWSLMQLQDGDRSMDPGKRDWTKQQHPTPLRLGATVKYSTQLRDLTLQCLAYLPHQRPTFDQIAVQIRAEQNSARKQQVNRLRDAPPTDRGFSLLLLQSDRYPLQTMLYESARRDPRFFNQLPPPTTPAVSPESIARRDSLGGAEGSTMVFPPAVTRTTAQEASERRRVQNAWREAETKRVRGRQASRARELMARLRLGDGDGDGKGPLLRASGWSTQAAGAGGGEEVGGKRKGRGEGDGHRIEGGDVEGDGNGSRSGSGGRPRKMLRRKWRRWRKEVSVKAGADEDEDEDEDEDDGDDGDGEWLPGKGT